MFVIVMEQRRAGWRAVAALPLGESEETGQAEAIQPSAGRLDFSRYPGCPHCHARSIIRCGCGAIGCWSGAGDHYACPVCRRVARIGGRPLASVPLMVVAPTASAALAPGRAARSRR